MEDEIHLCIQGDQSCQSTVVLEIQRHNFSGHISSYNWVLKVIHLKSSRISLIYPNFYGKYMVG